MATGEVNNLADSGEFAQANYGSGHHNAVESPTSEEISSSGDGSSRFTRFFSKFPRRYFLVLLAFFGFFNVYAMRTNLSVAVLYVLNNRTVLLPDGTTSLIPAALPNVSPTGSGVVLSAFFYGYIATQIPGGWLACRFGGKIIFGVGVAVSGLMALLTPLAVQGGFWLLVAARVVQGFFQGVTYPSMLALLSHWAPLEEKTIMATIIVAGSQFGTVVALPLSAELADTFGWPAMFYFFGVLALLWTVVWMLTIGETPYADKKIGKAELRYITGSVGYTFEQVRAAMPPWKKILTSAPVWAIIAAHFCENWGFYTMLTQLPTFLSTSFKFSMTTTSFLSALPYLVLGLVGPFAGFLADYLRTKIGVNTLLVRRTFNSIPLLAQAIFIVIAAHVTSAPAAVACIVVVTGLGGFVWSAFAVNQLDIAPQYAGVLMGLSNTIATIPGIIGPTIVGALVTHNYVSEWQLVFYIIALVYIFGAAIYAVFSSADRQRWADISGEPVRSLIDDD